MRKTATSKREVISAIRAARRRLKKTPTRSEFQRLSGIHWTKVQRLFGGYRPAVREAGLEPDPGGIRIDTAAMLMDFGRVARKVKRHPTRDEYERLGKYASASLETRFRRWSAVRESFLDYVGRNGLEREWGDVAESLKNGPVPRRGGGKSWLLPQRAKSAPVGDPKFTESFLPRIAADERGSKPFLPRINANQDRSSERQEDGNRPELIAVSGQGDRELDQIESGSAVGNDAGDRARLPHGLKPESSQQVYRRPECLPKGLLHPGNETEITADQKCDRTPEPRTEPIRAEILYPQLRGMRRVTNVMLWVMCAYQNTSSEVTNNGISADCADGRGWETMRTDRGVCATRLWAASLDRALYFPKRIIPGRPLMGAPLFPLLSQPRNQSEFAESALMLHAMTYEPVNEMGVVFLFGMVAPLLGFRVEALQAGFPDCKAKLEVEPGRWQDVNVEFEFESRKFREHHHDPAKCDIIVCWRHNWKGCPERIQVVELSRILGVSR